MPVRTDVLELAERARRLRPPVLTLVVPVPPSTGDGLRRAATHVGSALSGLDLPSGLRERVYACLAGPYVGGRTLVVFATAHKLASLWLPVEMPGSVHVRWGAADLTPLMLLLGMEIPVVVGYVDRDHGRLFAVSFGEIEEIGAEQRIPSPREADTLQQSKQVHPAHIPSRGGAARDNADQHVAKLALEFHRDVAQQLAARAGELDADVILMGARPAVMELEQQLSDGVRRRIAARLPGLSTTNAPASEVYARVAPTLEELRAARQQRAVASARGSGVVGLGDTLRALQQGRLEALVAPWPPVSATVFQHPETGYVASTRDGAVSDTPRAVALETVLPQLAEEYSTRIAFVGGSHAETVSRDLGGLAGIPRW